MPLFANAFMVFWLAGWTVGGIFALTAFSWLLIGKEIIIIEFGTISIGKHISSLNRTKKYDVKSVKNVEINTMHTNDFFSRSYTQSFFGLKGGAIKFDYGMKTIYFGSGIDQAEARMIIEKIKTNTNFKEENFS